MNTALENLYLGPLDGFSPPGVGKPPDQSSMLRAIDLLDTQRLGTQLTRFSTQYRQTDRRAVASLWSKWHFSALISSTLASNLLLDHDLPIGLDEVSIEVGSEGQTRRLWITDTGRPLATQNALTRFTKLIDSHLVPLITALADYSGASPKVFWSNAGNVFEYFTEALQTHPLANSRSVEPARELLASRYLLDGRRNPLFQPVNYLIATTGEGRDRRRRLCCIRYLIPELDYCSNCPLIREPCFPKVEL